MNSVKRRHVVDETAQNVGVVEKLPAAEGAFLCKAGGRVTLHCQAATHKRGMVLKVKESRYLKSSASNNVPVMKENDGKT